MAITHLEMVTKLVKPGQAIIDGLTPESAHVHHMAVGVSGEIGELLENIVDGGTRENKVEELGDIEFYHQAISVALNIDTLAVCPLPRPRQVYMGLAIAGAALLDATKKHAIYVKPIDRDEAVTQAGEIRTLLIDIYFEFGITRREALAANVHKLYTSKQARYKNGAYSDKQAQDRADKQE